MLRLHNPVVLQQKHEGIKCHTLKRNFENTAMYHNNAEQTGTGDMHSTHSQTQRQPSCNTCSFYSNECAYYNLLRCDTVQFGTRHTKGIISNETELSEVHAYSWEKSIYLTRLIISKILGLKRDQIMEDWRKSHWWNAKFTTEHQSGLVKLYQKFHSDCLAIEA
jgi:hypothetical protein